MSSKYKAFNTFLIITGILFFIEVSLNRPKIKTALKNIFRIMYVSVRDISMKI